MLKEILPISVGIILGGAAVYAGYKYMKKKHPENFKSKDELVKEQVAAALAKKLDDLKKNKRTYETVEGKDLTEWFKTNIEGLGDNIKMVIAIPTEEVMKGLGYPVDKPLDIDKDKNLIQWINDTNTKEILKVSLVSFNNIESGFQAKLFENEGMLVVTK